MSSTKLRYNLVLRSRRLLLIATSIASANIVRFAIISIISTLFLIFNVLRWYSLGSNTTTGTRALVTTNS